MLGIRADAEDIVQEAWLRWHGGGSVQARTPEAWLVTVVTRLSIDRLRGAIAEREHYVGPWLPEPLVEDTPESALEAAGDLSTAFLLMMERLAPEERAVFLLHQVFEFDYAEVAAMVGKSEAACRKTCSGRASGCRRNGRASPSSASSTWRCWAASSRRRARTIRPACRPCWPSTPPIWAMAAARPRPRSGRSTAPAASRAWWPASSASGDSDSVRYDLIQVNGGPGLLTWRDGVPDSITTLRSRMA
jgi:RNA polymerase sigma-70 factor (ECF subfamily)